MADEDGIKWMLEFDADIKGPVDALNVLGELDKTLKALNGNIAKVTAASHTAAKGHEKHAGSAHGLRGAFERLVHAGLEPFLHKAKEIAEFEFIRRAVDKLIELPAEIAHEVFELGEEAVMAAAKFEEMGITMKALFGKEVGGELMEYSDHLGAVTGIIDDHWQSIERTLGNAGFKAGPDLQRALEAVADLGALSGAGEAGAQEAAAMLAKLQNMGEVNPRMLASGFGLNINSFWQELSRQTGEGVKTLQKKMAEGKVDIEASKAAIYTLITKKTGKGLGGLGADVGEDFLSRVRRLKNLPEQLFESLANNDTFSKMSTMLGGLYDKLSPMSPLGHKIEEALGGAFTRVFDAISKIDVAKLADNIAVVIDVVGSLISLTVSAFEEVMSEFAHLVDVVGGFKDILVKAFTDPWGFLEQLGTELYDIAVHLGQMLWSGLKAGVQSGVSAVGGAIKGLASSVIGTAKDALGIHSPSQVFFGFGEMTTAGYMKGIENTRADVEAAVERIYAISPPESGGARAGGAPSVHLEVHVHAGGGSDADSIAASVSRKLEEVVPGMLQSAFEQLALQAGSAS